MKTACKFATVAVVSIGFVGLVLAQVGCAPQPGQQMSGGFLHRIDDQLAHNFDPEMAALVAIGDIVRDFKMQPDKLAKNLEDILAKTESLGVRNTLRQTLADVYLKGLSQPEKALEHLRAMFLENDKVIAENAKPKKDISASQPVPQHHEKAPMPADEFGARLQTMKSTNFDPDTSALIALGDIVKDVKRPAAEIAKDLEDLLTKTKCFGLRNTLRQTLADLYVKGLNQPDKALEHLKAILAENDKLIVIDNTADAK